VQTATAAATTGHNCNSAAAARHSERSGALLLPQQQLQQPLQLAVTYNHSYSS
jgi:hypothetical protein